MQMMDPVLVFDIVMLYMWVRLARPAFYSPLIGRTFSLCSVRTRRGEQSVRATTPSRLLEPTYSPSYLASRSGEGAMLSPRGLCHMGPFRRQAASKPGSRTRLDRQ